MPRNTAFQQILNNAVEKAQNDTPKQMKIINGGEKCTLQDTDKFFQELSDSFVENDVLKASTNTSMIRAAAFALRVVNSIDATKKIQKNIEEFFGDEKNNDWFAQQGITTDDEKNKLKEDLTKHVEEQLEVKANTDAGKRFVKEVKDCYEDYAETAAENSSFLQDSCAFLRDVTGMAFKFEDREAVEQAYTRWGRNSEKNNYDFVPNIMYNALAKESKELSQEVSPDLTPELVQHYGVYFGDSIKVKPVDFLEHAKTGNFTLEDKMWAEGKYQALVEQGIFRSVSMTDFMLNGKPMFSEEDVKNTNMDELSCRLVENMLKGEDVSIKKPGREPVHIDVQLIKVENKEKKGYLQRFFDFIKDLLNPGAKEMAAQKQKDLAENLETRKAENKAARQRISFDELTGKSAAAKFVMPPSKDKQLSAEHKLEKGGMSAGK